MMPKERRGEGGGVARAFNELEATCLRRELSLVAIALSLSLSLFSCSTSSVRPSAAIAISPSLPPSVSLSVCLSVPDRRRRAAAPPSQVKSLSSLLPFSSTKFVSTSLSSYVYVRGSHCTVTHSRSVIRSPREKAERVWLCGTVGGGDIDMQGKDGLEVKGEKPQPERERGSVGCARSSNP